MGKVFTIEEVREGRIPSLEAFGEVRHVVREALQGERAVIAALEFGSVPRGDHTIRSDYEVAVVYDWRLREQVWMLLQHLQSKAKDYYVPLEVEPIAADIADSRWHTIGPNLKMHMERRGSAGTIMGDVPNLLAPTVSPRSEVEHYLRTKLRKLEVGYLYYPQQDTQWQVHYLRKMLEAPIHVARKVLSYCGVRVDDDSKKAIRSHYHTEVGGQSAHELESLVCVDQHYMEALKTYCAAADIEAYAVFFESLPTHAPQVIDFIRSNAVFLDRVDSLRPAR